MDNCCNLSIDRAVKIFLYVFLSVFIFCALLTYSQDDPALHSFPIGHSSNIMGPVGANIADFLFALFGGMAWSFPVFLIILFISEFNFLHSIFPSKIALFSGIIFIIIGSCIILSFLDAEINGIAGWTGYYGRLFISRWLGAGGAFLIGLILTAYGMFSSFYPLFNALFHYIVKRRGKRVAIHGQDNGDEDDRRGQAVFLSSLKKRISGDKTSTDKGIIADKSGDEAEAEERLPKIVEPLKRKRSEDGDKQAGNDDGDGEGDSDIGDFLNNGEDDPNGRDGGSRDSEPMGDADSDKGGHTDFKVSPPAEFNYILPSLELLDDPPDEEIKVDETIYYQNARALEQKLLDFGVAGKVVEICPGPVVTMYEYSPAPGVKINKVTSLQDDIALALRSHSVRIVAPIPGKAVIGIELANARRQTVYLKEIIDTPLFRRKSWKLPLALGKDVVGEPFIADLARMPHLLIAGATGTGKSVGLNSMICSLLYKRLPTTLRLLMIDPKRIELSLYDGIPHLLHPVVSEPKEATKALKWAVQEMERRYGLLEEAGARNIDTYNAQKDNEEERLPYLIVIIDELADLMMVSSKEVEASIARLAQMARAAGIHLLIATQRPSVDVLTGLIKANFPARLSFKVSSKVDSRTILDMTGAETLLGRGDMLFLAPGASSIERLHGGYCSEDEINRIVEFWKAQGRPEYDLSVTAFKEDDGDDEGVGDGARGSQSEFSDKFYDEAIEIVTQSGHASISMIQRRLRIGYNRAARMIEQMEKDGIVSPPDSMGRRQVLVRGYSEDGE